MARLIGGIISLYFSQPSSSSSSSSSNKKNSTPSHLENIPLIIIASGFVLGEGLSSVIGLGIKSLGGEPISCWGCGSGGGGYCGGC